MSRIWARAGTRCKEKLAPCKGYYKSQHFPVSVFFALAQNTLSEGDSPNRDVLYYAFSMETCSPLEEEATEPFVGNDTSGDRTTLVAVSTKSCFLSIAFSDTTTRRKGVSGTSDPSIFAHISTEISGKAR